MYSAILSSSFNSCVPTCQIWQKTSSNVNCNTHSQDRIMWLMWKGRAWTFLFKKVIILQTFLIIILNEIKTNAKISPFFNRFHYYYKAKHPNSNFWQIWQQWERTVLREDLLSNEKKVKNGPSQPGEISINPPRCQSCLTSVDIRSTTRIHGKTPPWLAGAKRKARLTSRSIS